MRPVRYHRARDLPDALDAGRPADADYLFGGTTLIDLAKLDVLRPASLVDLRPLAGAHRGVSTSADGATIGAMTTMAEAARDPVLSARYPAMVESLRLAASPQIRNMASLGGNLLQRTRCPYYRDTSWARCNRRDPGSGCQAIAGVADQHAVLGNSPACIAVYPGDLAVALVAFDAALIVQGATGSRLLRADALHRLPGDRPDLEFNLMPGELITAIRLPALPWFARSRYVKLRNRASYEFAEASAAVALDMDGAVVRQARIALGGVATKPWRAQAAEAALAGRTLAEAADRAADAAFAGAVVREDTRHKVMMGRRALLQALTEAAVMETAHG